MRPFALSTTATCLLYQLLIQMSAAFDTVDHLLLDRLRIEFGVTEIPLTWLQSYLEGQTQFIKMAQHESHATEVDVGRGRRPTASIRARTSLVCGLLQPDHRRRPHHGVQYIINTPTTRSSISPCAPTTHPPGCPFSLIVPLTPDSGTRTVCSSNLDKSDRRNHQSAACGDIICARGRSRPASSR